MAIVIDQAVVGTRMPCTDNNTLILTTTNDVTAGGFIVLGIHWFLTGQTLSTVATTGLAWTIDLQGADPGLPNCNVAIASAQAPSGLAAGSTITATWTGAGTANSVRMACMSFTGVKTSSPVDTTVGPVGVVVAAPGWTTGSASIQAGSVLVGVSGDFTGITGGSTPVAPSLEGWDTVDCGSNVCTSAYRIEASAGPYAVAGTYSGDCQSATAGVAYLAAPTGGPVDTTTRRYQIRRSRMTSW